MPNLPFGTHLAIEHLKTDYKFFLIAALEGKGEDLSVKILSSLDDSGLSDQAKTAVTKELAAKLILSLQKYVQA